ncbi:acyl carrier protein [Anaerostipes sp.]|uniref:acyl carrier protein n=1 Tax=Anaerostipes sp. TaxID=1872530 RepID=UPI0025B86393|nr:acyl carrier protein [Anaerostipes sp.]MBS7009888.1 acyl carrier protein [Anaerostipes sp.]
MTNLEKYNKSFVKILKQKEEDLPKLKYRGIPEWDSLGHMNLMGELENLFDITMSTMDILEFTSYEKGKEVLSRYDVEVS